MKSKLLTREMLEGYGITEVTKDGKAFMGERELKQTHYQRKGKYKLQQPYAILIFGDKTRKRYYTTKTWYSSWTYYPITIPVSRVVYAWYHGEIPEGYGIDHIDTNTLNNNLRNLRLLTKEENLKRKPISRNQYNYWKTDEEILEERENKRYIYDRTKQKAVKADWWVEQKNAKKLKRATEKVKDEALRSLLHNLVAKVNEKQEARKAAKGVDMDEWRKLGVEISLLRMAIAETKKNIHK